MRLTEVCASLNTSIIHQYKEKKYINTKKKYIIHPYIEKNTFIIHPYKKKKYAPH